MVIAELLLQTADNTTLPPHVKSVSLNTISTPGVATHVLQVVAIVVHSTIVLLVRTATI